MYPEGLENFLKAHLAKYKVFLSNNNLLFIYHIEKHPDLASEFIKNFSEYGGAEDGLYDVMEKFLEIADKFPEAQTAFQEMYQHFCDTIKSQFIDRILKNDKDEQILTFTSWYPEKMRLGDSNMRVLKSLSAAIHWKRLSNTSTQMTNRCTKNSSFICRK